LARAPDCEFLGFGFAAARGDGYVQLVAQIGAGARLALAEFFWSAAAWAMPLALLDD